MPSVNCPTCGLTLNYAASVAGGVGSCPRCNEPVRFPITAMATAVIPAPSPAAPAEQTANMVAALLSAILPGLGQLCQGRILEGVIIVVLWIACIAASFICIGLFFLPFLWIGAIVDAALYRSR